MSSIRKIAFVSPRFAKENTVGGAETLMKNLAVRLVSEGVKVTFLSTCAVNHFTWENELPAGESVVDGINLIRFPVDEDRSVDTFLRIQAQISAYQKVSPEEEQRWIDNSVNSSALCKYLTENIAAFERIIVGPYLFGLSYNVSRIMPEKTILLPCLHDEGFAYTGLIEDMFKSTRSSIFNSVPEQKLAHKLYSLPNSYGTVVGIVMDPFELPTKSELKGVDKYIMYSGRRESAKNTPLLCNYLNVFRRRTGRDIKLVLTGSGPIEAPPQLLPHILDLGFVSKPEMHRVMSGAVAFCHPSVNESLGIVLLESWLSGTPVLVNAQCAATRYLCETSNGGLWFSSYPEFEEELVLLIENDTLRDKMAASGRDYVLRDYSESAVMSRLMKAIEA